MTTCDQTTRFERVTILAILCGLAILTAWICAGCATQFKPYYHELTSAEKDYYIDEFATALAAISMGLGDTNWSKRVSGIVLNDYYLKISHDKWEPKL